MHRQESIPRNDLLASNKYLKLHIPTKTPQVQYQDLFRLKFTSYLLVTLLNSWNYCLQFNGTLILMLQLIISKQMLLVVFVCAFVSGFIRRNNMLSVLVH